MGAQTAFGNQQRQRQQQQKPQQQGGGVQRREETEKVINQTVQRLPSAGLHLVALHC